MRKTTISLILLSIILMVSCNGKHDARISMALSLADSEKADSALTILNKIDRGELPSSDDAMYCLVYTMAQDKSGFDVDNDSLIREAYDWYGKKPTDTLYAKCMYYMGKYYALNDSSEKALRCFRKSILMAKRMHDYDTQCLSLFQQSIILRDYDPDSAIISAASAVTIYNNLKRVKLSNKTYYLLNLAECLSYTDVKLDSCISLTEAAIKYAIRAKDSAAISDSYQDLSVFYGMQGKSAFALAASKKSYCYDSRNNFSKRFALSQSYMLADSLSLAKSMLYSLTPLNLSDSILMFSQKRDIAIREHDWVDAEAFADSTDFYLDKKSTENLKTKNTYYNLMIQKEISKTRLSSENHFKSILIIFLGAIFVVIMILLYYIFLLKKKRMQELLEEKERRHQMEVNHKEKQIIMMRDFLLGRIEIISRLQKLSSSELIKVKFSDKDWREIELFLNSADDEFVIRLKKEFKDLTQKDLRFLMLVRLRLPYKSIALLYNIEEKSVKQRMFLFKKKLGLEESKMSTKEFIESY